MPHRARDPEVIRGNGLGTPPLLPGAADGAPAAALHRRQHGGTGAAKQRVTSSVGTRALGNAQFAQVYIGLQDDTDQVG